jgi:anaerobic selenocysteine-containing dehydrogenase
MANQRSVFRICTLCEATCGIEVKLEDDRVETIRGDKKDPFSRGYICPKAYGMKALEDDPDRLTTPMVRTANGFEPIEWDAAFDLAIEKLSGIRAAHGGDAVGAYLGNPGAHSLHNMLYGPVLLKALGTKRVFSASSIDQLPKMVSAGLMFGAGLTIPVPDVDRTKYLMIVGGNPLVSNGSLMTAPDIKGRLSGILERGGKIVVIDPRRTETADAATEHHFIRPGTDALFLLAMCNVIVAEGLTDLGTAQPHVDADSLARAHEVVSRFTPERVAERCGIDAEEIARLARELCEAESAACYGRIGTTCQEFGTLASWAVDLLNLLSGNLDRVGGAMFTTPAANRGMNRKPGTRGGRGVKFGRWKSSVKALPERFGELPVAALADEILDAGESRMRAMVTIAGNPLVSAPNVGRLEEAFASLDFMVSVDFYINETTRHADLILPPPSPLQRDTYDIALYQLAVRNVAKYSLPATPIPDGQRDEWEILLTLAKGLMGMADAPLAQADQFVIGQLAEREVGDGGRWEGLTLDEALEKLSTRSGPARMLDLMLRLGPYGDGFGRKPDGLTLATLEAQPHGVDLGPLKPQLPDVLRTPDAVVDAAPVAILVDLPRLEAALEKPVSPYVLIGRRHLRSNNSWMHNLEPLVKGKDRCTLLLHPDSAAELGVSTGDRVQVTSRAGSVHAPVEVTDEMMPGVVSLPHGWGHDAPGTRMRVAAQNAGVNVNILSDDLVVDEASGNAAFNGLPVTLTRHANG